MKRLPQSITLLAALSLLALTGCGTQLEVRIGDDNDRYRYNEQYRNRNGYDRYYENPYYEEWSRFPGDPDSWENDYDVSLIDLPGDITRFFDLRGNLAAIIDSSTVYVFDEYAEHWQQAYHVSGRVFLAQKNPTLLVDPDREVILGMPSLSGDYTRWDTLFEVPQGYLIHSAAVFQSDISRRSVARATIQSLDNVGLDYNILLGGEKRVTGEYGGERWVGTLLLKEVGDTQWWELELDGTGTVRNLKSLGGPYDADWILFTQGADIFAMSTDGYRPQNVYHDNGPWDPILSMYVSSSRCFAGTQTGRLLYSPNPTSGWRVLDVDFRHPILELNSQALLVAAPNRNEVWKIYSRGVSDRYDRKYGLETMSGGSFTFERIEFPLGFYPLTMYNLDLFGGENGFIAQSKMHPYYTPWYSIWRPPYRYYETYYRADESGESSSETADNNLLEKEPTPALNIIDEENAMPTVVRPEKDPPPPAQPASVPKYQDVVIDEPPPPPPRLKPSGVKEDPPPSPQIDEPARKVKPEPSPPPPQRYEEPKRKTKPDPKPDPPPPPSKQVVDDPPEKVKPRPDPKPKQEEPPAPEPKKKKKQRKS